MAENGKCALYVVDVELEVKMEFTDGYVYTVTDWKLGCCFRKHRNIWLVLNTAHIKLLRCWPCVVTMLSQSVEVINRICMQRRTSWYAICQVLRSSATAEAKEFSKANCWDWSSLYRDSNQSQRDLPALRWDRPRNSSCAFMESFLINSIFYFSFFFRNANWIYNKLQKSFIFQYTITLSSNWICNIKQVYFIFHIQFARYKICFWIAKPYTAQNHLVQCSTFISFYCKLNIKYT